MEKKSTKELERETIDIRRKNNRREIDELKATLQNLISQGLNIPDNKSINKVEEQDEGQISKKRNELNSNNLIQVPETKVLTKLKQTTNERINLQEETDKKKVKPYNVEETRQYMRKQKEKRVEQLKSNIKETAVSNDLKKQKLKELHEKSQQLVLKNIEAKRDRSKSRENKTQYIRPDSSMPSRERSVSRDRIIPTNLTIRSHSKDRQGNRIIVKNKPKINDLQNVANCRSRSTERKVNQNLQIPRVEISPHISPRNEIRKSNINIPVPTKEISSINSPETEWKNSRLYGFTKTSTNSNSSKCLDRNKSTKNTFLEKRNEQKTVSDNQILDMTQTESSRLCKPCQNPDITDSNNIPMAEEFDNINSARSNSFVTNCSNGLSKKSPRIPLENITLRSTNDVNLSKFNENFNKIGKKKIVMTTETDVCSRETKETQTIEDQHQNYSPWLQEGPSYPYNFINTVKRKLQVFKNSPEYVDIGIQSSIKSSDSKVDEDISNTKEQINNHLQKRKKANNYPELASYVSNKCLNLDPQSVQQFELVLNKSNTSYVPKTTIISKTTVTDSESDTSKNIPEISSESGASAFQNAESNKHSNDLNLQLNTIKLNNMKLKSNSNLGTTKELNKETIKIDPIRDSQMSKRLKQTSVAKSLFDDKASYTSDYNSESDFDSPSRQSSIKSPRSARDSIISRNFSRYSHKNKSEDTIVNSSSSIHTQSTKNKTISSLKTVNTEITKENQDSKEKNSNNGNTIPSEEIQIFNYLPTYQSEISKHSLTEASEPNLLTNKSIPSLKELSNSLKLGNQELKNITVRSSTQKENGHMECSNQIHLKFEAEIHLLNDFNKSLHRLSSVEKAYESIKNKNDTSTVLRNMDTQTSILSRSSTQTKISENINVKPSQERTEESKTDFSHINFSRGTDLTDTNDLLLDSKSTNFESSIVSSLETNNLSVFNDATNETQIDVSLNETFDASNPAGMSLKLFQLLIKDEDSRLKNLKTMLKIREKSLRDRMKTELAALEVQRRTLNQTGKLQEASSLKKKQRGIILKHSQEIKEMDRLKELYKAKSNERISKLKQERNLIRTQLSTDNMLTKMKVHTPKKRRQSGPMRVFSRCESVKSETSISRKSSTGEEIFSFSSKSQSITSRLSEFETDEPDLVQKSQMNDLSLVQMKKALLMREAALQKRRKQTENILEWNQKLLEEEKRIKGLESAANVIISRTPSKFNDVNVTDEVKLNGKILNQIWLHITGSNNKKIVENKTYSMSQTVFEQFCKNASDYARRNKKQIRNIESDSSISAINEARKSVSAASEAIEENIPKIEDFHSDSVETEVNVSVISRNLNKYTPVDEVENLYSVKEYTPDFEIESLKEITSNVEMDDGGKSTISSINKLIDNFNNIDKEITIISKESQISLNETGNLIEEIKSDISENSPNIVAIDSNNTLKSVEEPVSVQLNEEMSEELTTNKGVSQRSSLIEKETLEEQISEFQYSNNETVDEDLSMDDLSKLIEKSEIEVNSYENSDNNKQSKTRSTEKDSNNSSYIHSLSNSEVDEESEKTVDFNEISNNEVIEEITDVSKHITEDHQIKEISSYEEKEHDSLSEMSQMNSGGSDSQKLPNGREEISTEKNSGSTDNSKNTSLLQEKSEDTTTECCKSLKDVSKSQKNSDSIPSQSHKTTLGEKPSENESSIVLTDNMKEMTTSAVDEEQSNMSSEISKSLKSTSSNDPSSKSPRSSPIDVKKRVSEIMSDAGHLNRGDKSPRMQDLYVTTYDVLSPTNSPELGSPIEEENNLVNSINITTKSHFGSEAEELLKKQLAIEQEIKQLEQQQKEQLPYVFMREIPNKPPPPYTPPSSIQPVFVNTVLPSKCEEIDEITKYSAKIIHKAYVSKNLENINISENTLNLITKNISKDCYKYVFDICKEIAKNHYNQFKREAGPSWLIVNKKPLLAPTKPLDVIGLEKLMNKKLKELFGFIKPDIRENTIIKWSRKKRDHVDEILVLESQAEEAEWTNYDKDELIVKDDLTNDILKMLLTETADIFETILSKKTHLY